LHNRDLGTAVSSRVQGQMGMDYFDPEDKVYFYVNFDGLESENVT